jgi:heme iron utilization protein
MTQDQNDQDQNDQDTNPDDGTVGKPATNLPPRIRTPGLPEGYDARAVAHRLLRTVRTGTLATLGRDGFPFASLVTVATAMDGSPLLLLSGLSAHTQNLLADSRASILLTQPGTGEARGDPLAHPRLTVTGMVELLTSQAAHANARGRFLACHPKSALYADFGDFGFWRLNVHLAHLNGGFARAAQFDADVLLTSMAGAEALAAIEAEAIEHMNKDHKAAVQYYATSLLGLRKGAWRISAIDPEGMVLTLGGECARLEFPEPVYNGAELRAVLGTLARAPAA